MNSDPTLCEHEFWQSFHEEEVPVVDGKAELPGGTIVMSDANVVRYPVEDDELVCALCGELRDRPPVSGEHDRTDPTAPLGWQCGDPACPEHGVARDRPPVSGEPPQPQVHDETCTHPEEQRRTQVIEEPTIYEVCSACEHVMAIRTDRASTGAALDAAFALRLQRIADELVPGIRHDFGLEAAARLAEQSDV